MNRPHYTLITDGGCRGNPGPMYGSYRLQTQDGKNRVERRDYGHGTSNQAEYLTVITALDDLARLIRGAGNDPNRYTVEIRSDSQLVVKQLTGEWRPKNPELVALHRKAERLISQFGIVHVQWHRREHSVAALGH